MNKTFLVISIILLVVIIGVIGYFFYIGKKSTQEPLSLKSLLSKVKYRIKLSSPYIQNNSMIPDEFTCKGGNKIPKLVWENIPLGTKSFVLIMYDPDAPMGTFYHWIKYNIPYDIRSIESDNIGINIRSSFGHAKYGGPCPPTGEKHRYYFVLIALDTTLDKSSIKSYENLLKGMKGHILGYGCLMGLYRR